MKYILDEQEAEEYIGRWPVLWFSEGWSAFAFKQNILDIMSIFEKIYILDIFDIFLITYIWDSRRTVLWFSEGWSAFAFIQNILDIMSIFEKNIFWIYLIYFQ